ncbi:MAG: hypothetical protein ACE366_17930 [Bradymonadia bacterium]
MMRNLMMMAICVVLAGCGSKSEGEKAEGEKAEKQGPQTFAQAMTVVCDAPDDLADELDSTAPEDKQMKLANHIKSNVTNVEVATLFKMMATTSPAQRKGMMEAAAKKAGIEECSMLSVLD